MRKRGGEKDRLGSHRQSQWAFFLLRCGLEQAAINGSCRRAGGAPATADRLGCSSHCCFNQENLGKVVGARLFPGVLQWAEEAGTHASAACGKDGWTRLCGQLPQCIGHSGCLASWLFLSQAQAGLPTCQGNPSGYEIIGQLICHFWVLLGPKGPQWVWRWQG